MATVKDRVVALCKSHGITVRQLEEETKIGNVVSRWDKYNPRMPKLAAVAAYFSVPIESLLYDNAPEQKEIPAAISNEEYQDAILRGQNSYFLSLFQRLTPAQKDQTIAEILQKLQSQQVQDEQ